MILSSKQSETPSNPQTENLAEKKLLAEKDRDNGLKRFGLSKKERIKNKKEFDLVYTAGEYFISPSQKLKALYFIDRNSERVGIKTAYAVSKKAGNAVWRNRVKRLLRESYRLNKEKIIAECSSKSIGLLIVFSAYTINQRNSKKILLKDVRNDVVDLMNMIKSKL